MTKLGPRELTGAVDLLSHYGLRAHHDYFCKKPLPASIAETPYLNNVVGDTEIRKGEGMELDQLVQAPPTMDLGSYIQPFDLETLRQAFELRESGPAQLSDADRGLPTISGKVKNDHKDKEKKHKKHKDKDKDKDKDREHKKHKHRHKDKDKDKEKDKDKKKDKSGSHENGDDRSKKHHKKARHLLFQKRKHDGNEEEGDSHKHKKRKFDGGSEIFMFCSNPLLVYLQNEKGIEHTGASPGDQTSLVLLKRYLSYLDTGFGYRHHRLNVHGFIAPASLPFHKVEAPAIAVGFYQYHYVILLFLEPFSRDEGVRGHFGATYVINSNRMTDLSALIAPWMYPNCTVPMTLSMQAALYSPTPSM
eukprot:Gb_36547 [translate_table: standard]